MKRFSGAAILVGLTLASLCFATETPLSPAAPEAQLGCASRLAAFARTYFREVRETRGGRLLVVDPPSVPPPRTALGGLFTEKRESTGQGWTMWLLSRPRAAIQWPLRAATRRWLGTPYEFTPLKAFIEMPVLPLRWVVSKLSRGKKVPTVLFELTFGMAATLGMYQYAIEPAWTAQLEHKLERSIEEHAPEYDELISFDFRFRDIRRALGASEIDVTLARKRAFLEFTWYQNYYRLVEAEGFDPVASRDMLLAHPLFLDIRLVAEQGIVETEGFEAPEAARKVPDAATVERLLRIRHLLLLQYQLIPALVNDRESLRPLEAGPEGKALVASIEEDEFSQYLFELHRRGVIDKNVLKYRLQEDVYWRAKFLQWETIGVKRLKKHQGVFLAEPLTLDDIRLETVAELKRR